MTQKRAGRGRAAEEKALRRILRGGVKGAGLPGRELEEMPWAPTRQTISRWLSESEKDSTPLDQLLFVVGLASEGKNEAFREAFTARLDPDYLGRQERLRELEAESRGLRERVQELESENRKQAHEIESLKIAVLKAEGLRDILGILQEQLERIARGEPYEPPPDLESFLEEVELERKLRRPLTRERRIAAELLLKTLAEWTVREQEQARQQPFDEPDRTAKKRAVLDVMRGRLSDIRGKPGRLQREREAKRVRK